MSELSIITTQNVAINFRAASVGDRMLAFLIDLLIKIAYGIVVFYIFFYWFGLVERLQTMDNWSATAVVIIFAFPILVYSLVLESVFEGQTLGKKMVKIKVVKIEGYQANFGDYLIRWIFRIVETNMLSGLVGLLAMILNNKTQRLGDMAAETAVITLKNKITINSTILEELESHYKPTFPMVVKLSDNDVRIIKETFQVARNAKDFKMISALCQKIETVIGSKNQNLKEEEFVKIILKDYNFYTGNS